MKIELELDEDVIRAAVAREWANLWTTTYGGQAKAAVFNRRQSSAAVAGRGARHSE